LDELKLPELGDVEIKHADIAQETQMMLQPEIKKFINDILANTWNRYRKATNHNQKTITTLEDQIAAGWLGEC
jgi:hypothetical protein